MVFNCGQNPAGRAQLLLAQIRQVPLYTHQDGQGRRGSARNFNMKGTKLGIDGIIDIHIDDISVGLR